MLKQFRKRILSFLLMLVILLNVLAVAAPQASAVLSTIYVQSGNSRQILLGAPLTTGRLVSGTWSSSNPSVAEITSQGASYCYVTGRNSGRATLTCYYKYYLAGSYFTDYWHCYVEVNSSGSGSTSTEGSGPVTMKCKTTSITLDLANPSKTANLEFYLSGSSNGNYYTSIDVRKGKPTTVSYSPSYYSENGSPVFLNMKCILSPKKVGSESIKFQVINGKVVDGYLRFYNTTYSAPIIEVTVKCSHKFNAGVVIQEGTPLQSEIKEFTCSVCKEKKTEETMPAFGTADLIFPADTVIVEELAFEKTSACTVYIPDTCTSIGEYAFKNCTDLRKIRLPKNCSIAPNAFDGCELVYVYAPEGGTTMDYCMNHSVCKFITEK